MNNMDWYHTLNLPIFTPPDWIFAPVWIVLYLMIFSSFIVFMMTKDATKKFLALAFFMFQLLLNFMWSAVFFNRTDVQGAFVIIMLMWIFVLFTILEFYKTSKAAAYLLIPYFLWVSFAVYLNFMIYILN